MKTELIERVDKLRTMHQESMTLSEIAGYLHLSEKTVLRLADTQGLPVDKNSREWLFEKAAVDSWVTSKVQSASNDSLVGILSTKKKLIPLPRLISEERIIVDLVPGSKEEILSQLLRPLVSSGILQDPVGFLAQLLEREKLLSTALCDGVAIPHVREHESCGIEAPCIVLGICQPGVDFGSLDGESTRLFFLTCSPDTATHLRLLAKLTIMLRQQDMLERLSKCVTTKEVMDNLIAAHLRMSIEM